MSVIPNQTNATPGDAFFWKVTASTITAGTFVASNTIQTNNLSTGSLSVGTISTSGSIIVSGNINALNITASDTLTSYFNNSQYATVSQIFTAPGVAIIPELSGNFAVFTGVGCSNAFISSVQTTNILLDGNSLDTGGAGVGAVLLLNGYPIATTSTSISSLTEWSYYPAISTVYFGGNNILQVGELSGNTVNVQTVSAFDVAIDNQLTVGQTLFGNQAEFQEVITSDLTATTLEALRGSISSLTVSTLNTNSVVIPTGTFTNLNATNINTTNITAVAGNIGDLGVNTANINQLNATNATVSGTLTQNEVRGVNGFINEEAANRIRIRVQGSSDIFSSPELDLEAGGGNRGIVNVIANPGYAGVQGEVNITAKGGSALGYATGGLLNLTATNGSAVLGTANTSRVNIAADSITSYAGGPTPFSGVLGYNFLFGLLGVNIVAGTPPAAVNVPGTVYLYGLNPLGLGSSGGVRVQNGMSIDFITPYPTGFIAPQYDLFIRGNPAGNKVTMCNIRYLFGDGAEATGFNNVNATNLNGTNLNATNIFGTNITGSNVNGLIGNISSLTSLNADIQRLYNVSTINGLTVDQLVSTVTPPQFYSTVSTFEQLFTSSLQAVNITSPTANLTQISGVSTLNGYTVEQLISSVSPLVFFSTVSTFQQLFTSSFQAVNISTNTLTAASILLNGVALQPPQSSFLQLYTSSLQADQISSGVLSISSINGYNITEFVNPPVLSTFNQLFVSDATIFNQTSIRLDVSSINGYNVNQFLSTTGSQAVVSSFQNLYTSSLQANQISSGVLSISSINGFNLSQLANPNSISTTVSSFFQLGTSSLQANQISTTSINVQSLTQVSTINGITINQLVSSVSPPIPAPSTFNQLFTSSLAANVLTNYQTSNLNLIAPIVSAFGSNLSLTALSNISINASNAVSLYNTDTAPTVGTNDLFILGQGTTTLAGQGNTNVNAINNLLLNSGQITTVQGGQYVLINTSQQLQLNGSNEITATSSNIRLNGNLVFNGVPYNPNPTSTFTTLATDVLRNNTTAVLTIAAPFVNLSTGNATIDAASDVFLRGQGAFDLLGKTGIVLSTPTLSLRANTNVSKNLLAPQITTSSIVGNTITAPLQFASTIYTNTLRNNDSLGFELNIIAAYPSISSIATFIEGQNVSILASDEATITADQLYISSGDTYIEGPVALDASLDVKAITSLSSINGLPYTPGGGGGPTVSTFLQLFTSSIVVNTINGAAYPPPDSNTLSTFQQLFTSSILGTDATFSNITLVGGTAELFATEGSLQINASNTLTLGGGQGAVLLSLSNNILIEPGFISPAQLVIRGDTNFSNNNLLNVNQINGVPYQPSQSASTFSTIYTSSIFMNAGTFCNILALGTDPYIRSVDDLSIQASNTLAITAFNGMGLVSLSNDITLAAGFTGPGEVRITASPLNLCNFDINNVAVLNATTINNTTLNNTTINTTTINGRTATFSTMNAQIANISSATVSTINTFPYHKAFGTAWATGTTPMVGGVPTGVDWGGTHYFNLSDILSGETAILPAIQPRNVGIYQVNSRVTFSNSDSVVATASAYFNVDGYDDPISRVSVEIEPSRTASAIITWQGYIGEQISLSIYSDNSNVQMYEYPAGSPYPPYRAYAANITLNQLYSYEGGGAWPPNPLITP